MERNYIVRNTGFNDDHQYDCYPVPMEGFPLEDSPDGGKTLIIRGYRREIRLSGEVIEALNPGDRFYFNYWANPRLDLDYSSGDIEVEGYIHLRVRKCVYGNTYRFTGRGQWRHTSEPEKGRPVEDAEATLTFTRAARVTRMMEQLPGMPRPQCEYLQMQSSDLVARPVGTSTWHAQAIEEVTKDWKAYSKKWHASHGPKVTVDRRYVHFISEKGQERTVELESWRGNWRLNALIKAGIVRPRKGQMDIRLHEACDIRLVRKERGYSLYERTVKGGFVDYCLVSPMGMTFHGPSLRQCLQGLRRKRLALKDREEGRVIDFALLRKLGFCEAGIRQFCDVYDYSLHERVSAQEVYDRVMERPHLAAPFRRELRILAKYVGFSIPQFGV